MKVVFRLKGGPGSGHRGHRGIPGQRGGSLPGTGGVGKHSIMGGRVEVVGTPEFAGRVEKVLSNVPEWATDQIPREALEAYNNDRLGVSIGKQELIDNADHPLRITSVEGGEAHGARTLGIAKLNSIGIDGDLDDEDFSDTLLHEVGHHVDIMMMASRSKPAPRTRYMYDTGGDKLNSAVRKVQKKLERQLSVYGGGHSDYKRSRVEYRKLLRTVPGGRDTKSERAKAEIFAEAYSYMARGAGDMLPRDIQRAMGKYFKKKPPKRAQFVFR